MTVKGDALAIQNLFRDTPEIDLGARVTDRLVHVARYEGDVGHVVRCRAKLGGKLSARKDVVPVQPGEEPFHQ